VLDLDGILDILAMKAHNSGNLRPPVITINLMDIVALPHGQGSSLLAFCLSLLCACIDLWFIPYLLVLSLVSLIVPWFSPSACSVLWIFLMEEVALVVGPELSRQAHCLAGVVEC
jgi:hypothetical protein